MLGRLTRRMKRSPVLAFVLLSAVFSFGRTVSDEEIARAVLRAVRSHPGMPNPDSVQLSNVVVTSEGVCMEYRVVKASGALREGYAVYKTDKELVYIDNSWIWDGSCLAGKYGQRRPGTDVTESVGVALEARKKAPAVAVASTHITPATSAKVAPKMPSPSPDDVAPGSTGLPVKIAIEVPAHPTVVTAPKVASAPAQPAPLRVSRPVAVAPPKTVEVVTPPVVTVSSAPVVIVQAPLLPVAPAAPKPPVAAPPAPAPVAVPSSIAPIETGSVRGVTIADPYGALGQATPTAAGAVVQESLADAARRVKKAKQQ